MRRVLAARAGWARAGRLAVIGAVCALSLGEVRGEEIFRVDEARPGQKGYGLSVFVGDTPERFEVEVVGVLRNVAPGVSYLLARLAGHDLERTGVVAGMSGSPVWIDGRLAGAVSFGFSFGKDALAGITPIELMRAIPAGTGGAATGSPTPALARIAVADLAGLRLPRSLVDDALASLASFGGAPERGAPAVVWSANGFPAVSRRRLAAALGALGTFGSGGSGADARPLVAGGSVAGVLIDGDLQVAATGTVTERNGDELLAFGHPFLGVGATALPMASSEVVTIVASQASSFKLANTGPIAGAFVFDQNAGVRGRLGATAPQLPLTVKVGGPAGRTVNLRLAQLPQFLPALVASGVVGALDVAAAVAAQSVDADLRFGLADGRVLRLRQCFDGAGAASELVSWLVAVSSYLTLNPLAAAPLSSVELEVTPSAEPRGLSLVAVRPESPVVRPGEKAVLVATLAPYRGTPFERRVELAVPRDLPSGRYSLLVGDGASVDGVRLDIEPVDPATLDQVVTLLGSLGSRHELHVLGLLPARGVAARGETLSRLPGTWQSLRGMVAGRTDQKALRLAIVQRERLSLEAPLAGLARVELEVRRQAVLGGKEKP